jgi:hypothetical protein
MSKKPIECIGPCYPKGVHVLHPITLFYVTNTKAPFCTVRPYTVDGEKRLTQICDDSTVDQDSITDTMYTLPQLGLNLRNFLMLYQIYSYEDSSTWYNSASKLASQSSTNLQTGSQNSLQWATVRRVFDAVLTIYGEEKIPHMDDESAAVFQEILREYWLPKWTKRFNMTREKIMKTFTTDNIRHIVNSYFKAAKDRWQDVPSHMDLLKASCAKLLEEQKN